MTADIITFPVAKRPQVTREIIRDSIVTAVHWHNQGLRAEDLPADMDPDERWIMEVSLYVISKLGRARP